MANKLLTQKKFQQISEALKPYQPEKVILFGSWAWGKPKKDSDFDLLIIKKTKRNYFRRIPEVRSYLFSVDNAFDILVMTPKEVSRRLRLGDFFIKEILKKGKILYEAKK